MVLNIQKILNLLKVDKVFVVHVLCGVVYCVEFRIFEAVNIMHLKQVAADKVAPALHQMQLVKTERFQ